MTADELHAEVLASLLELTRGDTPTAACVRLIARLQDDERLGRIDASTAAVFLPDFHLTTRRKSQDYKYSFHFVTQDKPSHRAELLEALLLQLRAAQRRVTAAGGAFELHQLGDFIDFWRARDFIEPDAASVKGVSQAIFAEMPFLVPGFVERRTIYRGRFLAGNHDPHLASLDGINCARSRLLENGETGEAVALVTHGDLFDDLEQQFSEGLKRTMVRLFGPDATPSTYAIPKTDDVLEGSRPAITLQSVDDPIPAVVNVCTIDTKTETGSETSKAALNRQHELLAHATEAFRGLRAGNAADAARLDLDVDGALPDLQAIVVGHSHHPRIVAVDEDGEPAFVLFDPGAWIEKIRINDGDTAHSAQVGVLCGSDARIYQLDPLG